MKSGIAKKLLNVVGLRRRSNRNRRILRYVVLIMVCVLCVLIVIKRIYCGYSYESIYLLVKDSIDSKNVSSLLINGRSEQRAIIIYYPADEEEIYFVEVRWLYRCWIEMMINGEPKEWRSDLLIFSGRMTLNFKELGCLFEEVRKNISEPPQCRVFLYEPIISRHSQMNFRRPIDLERSSLLWKYLGKYPYVDSVNIISEGYPVFAQYHSILRTDIDVFLTKYFSLFPSFPNETLVFGLGGYGTEFNQNRLRRIAKDMGWSDANVTSIGSTWYGSPRLAQRLANFTLKAMIHLSINEFCGAEKEEKFGIQLWPDWHYGVVLLYGSHLAVNHLLSSEKLDLRTANQLFDQSVTDTDEEDLKINRRLHLHCWHTDLPFSKFDFKNNRYNCLNPQSLLNKNSAQAYALRMALQSRFFTLEQMNQLLRHIQRKKST